MKKWLRLLREFAERVIPAGCSHPAEVKNLEGGGQRTEQKLVFYLGRDPVGVFVGPDYPTSPGRVEYDPYRGQGHANLAASLKQGKTVRCWFLRRRGWLLPWRNRNYFEVSREDFVVGPPGGESRWYLELSRLDNAE